MSSPRITGSSAEIVLSNLQDLVQSVRGTVARAFSFSKTLAVHCRCPERSGNAFFRKFILLLSTISTEEPDFGDWTETADLCRVRIELKKYELQDVI